MTGTIEQIYHQLWAEKYVPRYAAEQQEEQSRRNEDFVDVPRLVAGQMLRPITAWDLFILDGAGSPMVTSAAPYAKPSELAFFLWYQRADPKPRFWPSLMRDRFIYRLKLRYAKNGTYTDQFLADLGACLNFVDATFADNRGGTQLDENGNPVKRQPPSVCFLASILVTLASEIGPVDPLNGEPLAQIPLGRLWQYQRVLERKHGAKPMLNDSDAMKSECLIEAQRLFAEQAASPS
jgi:hypothetical protein